MYFERPSSCFLTLICTMFLQCNRSRLMAYGSRIIWFAITQIFVTDPFNFIVVLIFMWHIWHVCLIMYANLCSVALLTSPTLIIYIMYAITRCSLLTPCAINTHFSILYFQCFLIEFAHNVAHKACCFKLCRTCAVILAESFQLSPDFVHFFLIIFVSLRISNTELQPHL